MEVSAVTTAGSSDSTVSASGDLNVVVYGGKISARTSKIDQHSQPSKGLYPAEGVPRVSKLINRVSTSPYLARADSSTCRTRQAADGATARVDYRAEKLKKGSDVWLGGCSDDEAAMSQRYSAMRDCRSAQRGVNGNRC